MRGIAGRVAVSRDLTGEREVTDAMTETMVCRRPDAAGSGLRPTPHSDIAGSP